MSDQNAATPAAPENNGTPPVAPAATPAPAAGNPPATTPETVTLTKEAHDQLQRDAARAATNQRAADLWNRTHGGKSNGHFKAPATPPAAPSDDDRAAAESAEDAKAERGLLALAADPTLRAVFDADPTLRALITSNPLAVLPMYAKDAFDADDAVAMVKEALLKKTPAAPATPPTPPTPPVTPPVGAINANDVPVDQAVEAARKLPNTESAIAGMIGAKMNANRK